MLCAWNGNGSRWRKLFLPRCGQEALPGCQQRCGAWQWVIKPFIRCLEARRHQGLSSKQEPSGAGSVRRRGRDAKAAWKKVWASSSSPNSLNPPCEQLNHVQPCLCSWAEPNPPDSRGSPSSSVPGTAPHWSGSGAKHPVDLRDKGNFSLSPQTPPSA